jgi:glutaredoxin
VRTSRTSLLGLVALVLGVSAASQWWGHRQESSLGRSVAALAQPGDLKMLSSDTCAVCVSARRWFTEHAVPFQECSIERDAACRQQFEALQAPGTPVILVRGRPELGFNPVRLRERLKQGA